jgi:hypothetical protein
LKRNKIKPHRYLFDKVKLVREGTAAVAINPNNGEAVSYLRGLCDALHGSHDGRLAKSIHMARQVIIATKE